MPSPKPRKRPARRGAYADAVKPEHSAEAYHWHCPDCPCETNLRSLLREECSRCGHRHWPDVPPYRGTGQAKWREEPTP